MQFSAICEALRRGIERALIPLIDRNYRLLEIPDYPNVGDVLIFQGEIDLLRQVPYKCLEMATMSSFARRLPRISEDDLLIFSGGGYFGDLWPAGPSFQKTVLSNYPNNPMLILPQSVCFCDNSKLDDAIKRYGDHKNLRICLRDKASYDFVTRKFSNQAYLVPDMAFYANIDCMCHHVPDSSRKLLLLRRDKEFKGSHIISELCNDSNFDVRDWPTMDDSRCRFAEWMRQQLRKHRFTGGRLYDSYVRHIYKRSILHAGIELINQYDQVVSTRLHGCVLALLLKKKVQAIDNSYGKIHALIETWLSDCDEICELG